MLILHQYEISPFCDKVRRILHWKGVPYAVSEIPLGDRARVRRLSPVGKLPVIEHEGRVVADSTEIAWYLEERFPERPLLPADPAERGRVHVLEDWADESLYFYEMRLRFTFPRNRARWVAALLAHPFDVLIEQNIDFVAIGVRRLSELERPPNFSESDL